MASVVGALGGIKYGAKLYGYFLFISLLGGIIALVGIGIAVNGMGLPATGTSVAAESAERFSPNLGQVLAGSAIALTGLGVTQAGFMGAVYKIVADAVYTGNVKSRKAALSDTAQSND